MHRLAGTIRPRPSTILATAAALLAGTVFLVGSPAPAAQSPDPTPTTGPMRAVPPSSPMPVPTGPLFAPPSVDPLDAKAGKGAAIAMPAELVGAWYAGNLGGIGYVDPTTGVYSEGRTQGIAYTFSPDGTWQFGFLTSSQLYGCAMKVMVFREGVLASVDEAAHLAELDTQLAQIHSEDTCVADFNYDRDLAPDDETIIWTRTTDEYGDALLLRGPTTEVTVFRPAQAG